MSIPDTTIGSSIDVLHVDDNPQFAEMAAAHLRRNDERITVQTKNRPREALNHLEANSVDCIVSDYQMPGMDGIELLNEVRDDYPNIPFILFTGKGSEAVAAEATTANVTGYLKKGSGDTIKLLCTQIQESIRRSRAERIANLANDRLNQIFEHIDGFYAVDTDWSVTYWNQTMADRTGVSPESAVGEPLWEIHETADTDEVRNHLQTIRDDQVAEEFEVYVDSTDQWLKIHGYPVDKGVFVQSRNITTTKNKFQELERRNQRLESVARTFSHDLKNPLYVAEGRLDLVRETGELAHLEDVAHAHNRMQNLIDELLRLANAEDMEFAWEPLQDIVDEAWSFAETGDTSLITEFEREIDILSDSGQCQRIFENLFENAVEHGNASKISIRVPDNKDKLVISDNGEGTELVNINKIFESGTTSNSNGTGYGLTIVEQIAHEHGWEVSVSDPANGGLRFEITSVELNRDIPRTTHQ